MTAVDRDLRVEDGYVLMAVHALLGLISPDVSAVALEFPGDVIVMKFWVVQDSADVRELVNEVVFEMEALTTPDDLPIQREVVVGPRQVDWETWAGRMIYHAKE